jgi:hypothetical protein
MSQCAPVRNLGLDCHQAWGHKWGNPLISVAQVEQASSSFLYLQLLMQLSPLLKSRET